MQQKSTNRIESLDYLRGMAAAGIMAYHMQLLNFGEVDASAVLGKIKIYGVSIFYILSGLTLYKVYAKRFSIDSIGDFYKKRVFRIVPLLWLVTVLTYFLEHDTASISFKKFILNIAVLPGIIRPDVLIANGAWSIGNECCFYLFFPFVLLLSLKKKLYLWITIFISFAVFVYFTYKIINPSIPLGRQWANYVNPFNQIFFFLIGLGIGSINKPSNLVLRLAPLLSVLFIACIFLFKIHGEPVVLISGINRIILSFFVIASCYFIYLGDFSFLPGIIKSALQLLGEISYSIYLLHPIVYLILKQTLSKFLLSPYTLILLTVGLTLVVSYFVYEFFEKYFVGLGKRKTKDFELFHAKKVL